MNDDAAELRHWRAKALELERERDLAIRASLVWSEEKGWHVGNPHCFTIHQAQRLYAIRQYLNGERTELPDSSPK